MHRGGAIKAIMGGSFRPIIDKGRAFFGNVVEAPAYPGAKPSFLIDELDNHEWLCELIRITTQELPLPKPKKKTVSKTR
jgi:hypothetical protein